MKFVWPRLQPLLGLVRLRPFDVATEAGRSQERHRRVLITAIASAGARAVAMLTALISIPLTLGYLGHERYGLWVTMSSFVAMLGFADLGLGNGLLNAIAHASGRDDSDSALVSVSSAFVALGAVGALTFLAFLLLQSTIPWSSLFNTQTTVAANEAPVAVLVLIGSIGLNMVLGLAQRVQLGYQEGFLANIWQAGGSLLGLALLLVAVQARAGLPWLVAAIAGGPVVANCVNSLLEFGWRRRWLAPRWRYCRWTEIRRLVRIGTWFVVLQLAASIAFASDNFVIAHICGPEVVPEFAVPMRLFAMISTVAAMFLAPLWPAYGEAAARGDRAWVRRTLRRSFQLVAFLVVLPALALFLFGKELVELWVGSTVHPSHSLLLGLAVWTIAAAFGSCIAMLLNGLNRLGVQVLFGVVATVAAVIVKIVFAEHLGVAGVAWAAVLVWVPAALIPLALLAWRLVDSPTLGSSNA